MKIIVTDLTKFKNQGLVCLAGVNPDTGECIRPFLTHKDPRGSYIDFEDIKKFKIIPGSILEGDFKSKNPKKVPHSEDNLVSRINIIGNSSSEEFQQVLEDGSFDSIEDGFGSTPVNKSFTERDAPDVSIITLKISNPRANFSLTIDNKFPPPSFKAHIRDSDGFELNFLKVTDLGFLKQLERIQDDVFGLQKLNSFLKRQETLYLRIGLSQPWAPDAGGAPAYWLQLNGIYSFPDFREDLRIYE